MEERILAIMELEGHKEMIKTQEMTIYYDKSDCASEIADMVKAFTEWVATDCVKLWNRADVYQEIETHKTFKGVDGLFNYYWNNIKDK